MGRESGNIIFLDIDGVVCTTLSTRISTLLRRPLEEQIFDPVALFWLRWLVDRSGAKIVLCSSWRDALEADDPLSKAFLQNLYDRLAQNGTPIIDAAPRLPNGDKGEDILKWLSENVYRRYVILDDHDCFALGPQVRRNWIPIPVDKGLRRREAKAAFQLLQGNS